MPSLNITAITSMDESPPPLPNPFTPLAFVPPEIATQLTVSAYILITVSTVHIWDTLTHLVDDYRLLTRHKAQLAMVVYFISRISTLIYLVGFTVINTAPVENCGLALKMVSVFYLAAIPSSELLLLLHLRAVYMNSKPIKRFFTFLWICTIGGSTTPVISAFMFAHEMHLGPSKHCIGNGIPGDFVAASAIVPLVNDTLLFIALAWRLHQFSYREEHEQNKFTTVVLGKHLPKVSKVLFQNGQAYFLSTVLINITTVVVVYTTFLPQLYRLIMGFPCIAVMNIMASRVYRNLKIGSFDLPMAPPPCVGSIRVDKHHINDISPSESMNQSRRTTLAIPIYPLGSPFTTIVQERGSKTMF